ncbi:roadblock/LC7 domain-containing protein [Alcanivorax sp. S6407]|uniref:roadblock/LC7 domain-containing protein n=1 Tax=Alcanivorax sp. S6407 TaxID=2926424 RepID=UPI001FF1C55B|nr:roadblock/LC7 domain-containing protein [Alcanivorax sp. S6407]MCK0152172.1 roadblock/LC7 domain-containing protein [Alcanivorax sp. S6407]
MTAQSPLGKVGTSIATKQLEKFGQETKGVTSAVLLTNDGFQVASLHLNDESASKLAAMGSSLAAIGQAIAKEASLKECSRMIVESESGVVTVMEVRGVSPPMSLAVIANDASVLGQLLWASKECCRSLAEQLSKK